MAVQTLRFEKGYTIALPADIGKRALWVIQRRTKEGYWCRSQTSEPDKHIPHDEIFDAYLAGELEWWPCNVAGLDKALGEMLQTDIEGWPERQVFVARCREQYVMRAAEHIGQGKSPSEAYELSAKEITEECKDAWAIRAAEIKCEAEFYRRSRARATQLTSVVTPLAPEQAPDYLLRARTVQKWYLIWDKAGRDLRALIARDHKRGDHRLRFPDRRNEQTDPGRPLCIYGAMELAARQCWMKMPRVFKAKAHSYLNEVCDKFGIPRVSQTTFYRFLKDNYTEFDEYRARYGARAAYLKFSIFENRALPTRALEEVEVDHCLLDVFATDGRGRTARPWLTVIMCRATKMIVGIHLSFEVPSYFALSRAVIHAIGVKDLSAFPSIKNEWPCHGVPDLIITDRGLDFLSESFKRAGRSLHFSIVNLPGRMPHLKGTVERLFRTIGVRVLSYLEGTTFSRTPNFYDPKSKARYSLAELNAMLVAWIVDDYHQTKHRTLGKSPMARWNELVDDPVNGGVRPSPNLSELVMLMGETATRHIGNRGIEFENNLYASPELEAIRKSRAGRDKFKILSDPTDRGHIWIMHERRWLIVPAVNQKTSKGLNKFAMKIVSAVARQLAGPGNPVTPAHLEKARVQTDKKALKLNNRQALRYLSDGALATQLVGGNGILTALAGPVEQVNTIVDDQGNLFTEVELGASANEPASVPHVNGGTEAAHPERPRKPAARSKGSNAPKEQQPASAAQPETKTEPGLSLQDLLAQRAHGLEALR